MARCAGGHEVADGVNFCPQCGRPVQAASSVAPPPQAPPSSGLSSEELRAWAEERRKQGRGKRVVLWALGAIFGIGVLVTGIRETINPTPTPTPYPTRIPAPTVPSKPIAIAATPVCTVVYLEFNYTVTANGQDARAYCQGLFKDNPNRKLVDADPMLPAVCSYDIKGAMAHVIVRHAGDAPVFGMCNEHADWVQPGTFKAY